MSRVGLSLLLACLLVAAGASGNPAKAGDYGYNGDGYYHHRYSSNVWYSSNCCYRKVVRHSAHYERIYGDDYYYGHRSYYEPSYRSSYYDRPYRSSYYGDSYRYGYYDRPYRSSYYGDSYRYGYSSYRYRGYGYGDYASYADSCYSYPRKIRMDDDRGGWVWGKRRCY